MSRRVSFWGGLSLSLLMLGGCLLADVGTDPKIDEDVDMAIAAARANAGVGGSSGPNEPVGPAGASGSASMSTAGSGGEGGSASVPPVTPPAQGGSYGMGAAGTANVPANTGNNAGAGGSGGTLTGTAAIDAAAADVCPDNLSKEDLCLNYCDTYTRACGTYQAGGLRPYLPYENSADCAQYCFLQSGWEVGTISQANSILCRCWHAVAAATAGPDPHCFHAAREPMGGCQ
jgi:hypothetical protein